MMWAEVQRLTDWHWPVDETWFYCSAVVIWFTTRWPDTAQRPHCALVVPIWHPWVCHLCLSAHMFHGREDIFTGQSQILHGCHCLLVLCKNPAPCPAVSPPTVYHGAPPRDVEHVL